jgi:proteasome lid subunit RPN8/RPN11
VVARTDGGPVNVALMPELRAAADDWQRIAAEAEARYPNEACGFVVRKASGQLESVAAPNLQDRYHALDPAAYPRTARTAYKLNERLIAKAQDAGDTLVCIWHSHCDAGAYFSGEDVRCAAPEGQELYPGVRWLVVSVLGGKVANAAMYVFAPEVGEFFAE